MIWRQKVKAYLTEYPQARLLENRPITVYNILKKYQNPNLEGFTKTDFVKYWSTLQTIDRAVRDIQAEYPELTSQENEIRKQQAEVDTLESLGYTV